MLVTLHGETLSLSDKDGIRSHCRSHGMQIVGLLKGKRLRSEFERFFADVYYLKVIAGAVLAEHEINKDITMPVSEFEEVMTYLNATLGEANATVEELQPGVEAEFNTPAPTLETVDGYRTRRTERSEGPGAEDREPAPPGGHDCAGDGSCRLCPSPVDRDTAASAVDGH